MPELLLGLVASVLSGLLLGDVPNQETELPRTALGPGDRCDPALEPPDACRDREAVVPEMRAIRLEDLSDDFGQAAADLLAERLTMGLAEQFGPRHRKQVVIGGPDLEVGAILVDLEHEIVE